MIRPSVSFRHLVSDTSTVEQDSDIDMMSEASGGSFSPLVPAVTGFSSTAVGRLGMFAEFGICSACRCFGRGKEQAQAKSLRTGRDGRCPKGHLLEMYSMPKGDKAKHRCSACCKSLGDYDTYTRSCRRCDYDVCERISSAPSGCPGQCEFGLPFDAAIHMQGPALSSRHSAKNVLADNDDEWYGPNNKTSWFILDLKNWERVGGFEMRNATDEKRCADEYTIERSKDDETWEVVVRGRLDAHSDLVHVQCNRSHNRMRYIRFTYQSHGSSGGGLRYFGVLNRHSEPPLSYIGARNMPRRLWDCEDAKFLELVKCHAVVRIILLEPKTGQFSLRMKCHWSFRTKKESQSSELLLRGVPGIRMPSLTAEVAESRFWKVLDDDKASNQTVYWEGTSMLALQGFKVFNMGMFPFDRQIINLEQFHFVWRANKDDPDYYKPMQVVSFTMETTSVQCEWLPKPAYIIPIAKYTVTPEDINDPAYASSFIVKLRVEHQHGFYIWQVFFPALLMTLTSICPLAMPPGQDDMGDRLSVYGGGLLTLVAFKYAIVETLPSVPYPTFTDMYLRRQLITVSACAFESVISFNVILGHQPDSVDDNTTTFQDLDWAENLFFYTLCMIWVLYFLYAYWYMPRMKIDWRDVWTGKDWFQHHPEIPLFENSDPTGEMFKDDCSSIAKGVNLVAVRDEIAVWDVAKGEQIGQLVVREVVEAIGAAESSEIHGRRFDPKDDRPCTKQEALQRGALDNSSSEKQDKYWNCDCEARMMIPISFTNEDGWMKEGAVEWQYMRVDYSHASRPRVRADHKTPSLHSIRPPGNSDTADGEGFSPSKRR